MIETWKRRLSLWGPAACWCAAIFHLSGIPDLSTGLEYDYPLRKLGHMAEYAVLFLLTRRALRGTFVPHPWRWDAAAAVFSVLYAAGDELHQSFVPGRSGNWPDVGIDSAGVAAAAAWVKKGLTNRGSSPIL